MFLDYRLVKYVCGCLSRSYRLLSTVTPIRTPSHEGIIQSHLTDADKRRLQEYKLELHLWYESGKNVCDPDIVTDEQWKYILSLPSRNARRREFSWLGLRSSVRHQQRLRKDEWRIESRLRRDEVLEQWKNEQHIVYGLMHTSLLPRITRQIMQRGYENRSLQQKQADMPKLVFDFSYDSCVSKRFSCIAASQFHQFYLHNRKNLQQFDMHITSFDAEQTSMQHLNKICPQLTDAYCSIGLHRECFSELYPRERIVYLTPHSPNMLTEYNANDVYVVGGVIEKALHEPITLTRPIEMNIRTAWFPCERHLNMRRRALPMNIVGRILLELKNTNDWTKALEHIPFSWRIEPLRRQERHVVDEMIKEVVPDRIAALPRIHWDNQHAGKQSNSTAVSKEPTNLSQHRIVNPFR